MAQFRKHLGGGVLRCVLSGTRFLIATKLNNRVTYVPVVHIYDLNSTVPTWHSLPSGRSELVSFPLFILMSESQFKTSCDGDVSYDDYVIHSKVQQTCVGHVPAQDNKCFKRMK